MGKVTKGFSLAVAILGVLCLIWGACISIISWVVAGNAPTSITVQSLGPWSSTTTTETRNINSYWWGGCGFLIPGILGIVAGCTRNTAVMTFFLIFDILCLLASIGMTVVVGLVVVFWQAVNQQLRNDFGGCKTALYDTKCVCVDVNENKKWTMDGTSCEDLQSIQTMLIALVVLGGLAALVSSIASYVSCCSLCNQEQDYHGAVVVQQPAYAAPAPMVVTHTNVQYAGQQYPGGAQQSQTPPPYLQHPAPQQPQGYVPSHDKARLVENQVV